jgi:hypothetical protein
MSSARGSVSRVTGLYENWICNVECCSSTVSVNMVCDMTRRCAMKILKQNDCIKNTVRPLANRHSFRLLHKSCTQDYPAASVHVFKHVAAATACRLTASGRMGDRTLNFTISMKCRTMRYDEGLRCGMKKDVVKMMSRDVERPAAQV